ncbi:unnamed protein product [Fraxinus pennsylvanica]|uniref:AB hydrolase-1 domain-containing protein n=1 Tax=Fraxinus pennsylvanica TaxID=56036 RepID=A0AAD1ZDE3_9LAMI|nr:unnamed protein product [Fraxinus pennsylvanica]
MEGKKQQKHFVLVHGVCHGAWCWYRLQSLLEAEGHRVTAIDLAASGINPKKLDELCTFSDYTQPLFEVMESIPPYEKVVLVGHSLGGMNMAFAMEKYPHKISVAVFITAIMPDTVHRPSYFLEQCMEYSSDEDSMDNQIIPFGKPEDHLVAMLFGPQYTSSKLYQLCPSEVTNNIEWNQRAAIVKEIKDPDHMAMISKPHKLCQYVLDIALEGKGPRPSLAEDFIALSLPQSPLKEIEPLQPRSCEAPAGDDGPEELGGSGGGGESGGRGIWGERLGLLK